jgi:hypothetical protein
VFAFFLAYVNTADACDMNLFRQHERRIRNRKYERERLIERVVRGQILHILSAAWNFFFILVNGDG